MEHNPRVIELAELPGALSGMDDVDPRRVEEARGLQGRGLRALRLDAVAKDEAASLRAEAERAGAVTLPGRAGASGVSPLVLVADDATLRRIGAALEGRGARTVGAAIRGVLDAYSRTAFSMAFADGTSWDLGAGTRVMGVLNLTPDSFSDGAALRPDPAAAADAAARLAEDGADLIDVGGESTRPGATAVPEDEEVRRVVPAIRAIRQRMTVRISIDTTKASVARLAIEAGADMVNDVSALSDPAMAAAVRESHVPIVLMHMRGTPRTMQHDTEYVDLLSSVVGFLRKRVERAAASGIADDKILVDPGLGFGKSAAGSLRILRELGTLKSVGKPLVVGASRKSFIGAALDLPVGERLEGSLAAAAAAVWNGAHLIRAHDVAATKRTTRLIDAIRRA